MIKRARKDRPDPIDVYVGSRIRTRRVGLKLSQTKLGEAIGVTFQQIQKYENGTNRIGASNLHKIARSLDVDVSYFYEGLPESETGTSAHPTPGLSDREPPAFEHDPMQSREAIELMHNYFRIGDSSVRRRLFQFVRSLADSEDMD